MTRAPHKSRGAPRALERTGSGRGGGERTRRDGGGGARAAPPDVGGERRAQCVSSHATRVQDGAAEPGGETQDRMRARGTLRLPPLLLGFIVDQQRPARREGRRQRPPCHRLRRGVPTNRFAHGASEGGWAVKKREDVTRCSVAREEAEIQSGNEPRA